MSKQPKQHRGSKPPATVPRRGNSGARLIGLALVGVAAVGIWWWKSKPTRAAPESSPATETQATNTAPPAPVPAGTVARAQFQKLIGKWQRLDGDYVIEIKSVDADGKLDAAYFNPKPIHVARALAAMDGPSLKMFIELRDVNYPGSTYTLVYDSGGDYFTGIYYQALQQQSFEVNFARMK
jgi:hypothetical protein